MMGAAPPASPFAGMMGGMGGPAQGPDDVQQSLSTLIGQIRDISNQVDQISDTNPALAPDVQQIRTILRGMIVKAAQQAPGQTSSSLAVPTAGQ